MDKSNKTGDNYDTSDVVSKVMAMKADKDDIMRLNAAKADKEDIGNMQDVIVTMNK
jgi:hypothetical protein